MRIYLLGTAYPFRGGLASFNQRLALELQNLGHEVELWTFTAQYPALLFPGKTQYEAGPPPHQLKIRPLLHAYQPWQWRKVGQLLKKEAPDLLICAYWHSFMAPAFAKVLSMAKQNHKTKTIGLLHNLLPHERKWFDPYFAKLFLRQTQACLTLSQAVAQQVQHYRPELPTKTEAHPLYDNYGEIIPKSLARQQLQLPETAKIVLFFGFVRAYKGLDLLLEALLDARLKNLNVQVIIAGEFYDKPSQYQTWLQVLEQEHRLHLFNEFIPHEQVAQYFCAADLVVQPYRHATQSGISQLAYHFEIPMVVTEVGGLPEIVPHGQSGYVVPPNASAIAEAIADFYLQQRIPQLLQGLRQVKQQFSWTKLAQTLIELHQALSTT